MTDTTDHAALRAEIKRAEDEARDAFHAMWHVGREGTPEEHAEAITRWQMANARHAGLMDGGFLAEVGPFVTADDGEPRND